MYDFPSLTLPSPSIPLYQSRRLFRRRVSTLSEPFEMIDPKPKKKPIGNYSYQTQLATFPME